MKSDEILNNPLLMLQEIEAYLTFKGLSDTPISNEDRIEMKKDVAECLRRQGIEVDYKPIY